MNITLTAKSPIVHGEFSDGIDMGNMMNFRRLPMIRDGKIHVIPVISGNAIRGVLRRLLAREVIDTFDLKQRLEQSFDKFYIAIANGGNLDKSMDVSIDTEKLRKIRSAFPMLSVFGASLYKYMMPGMLNVGFAVPKCLELGTGDIPVNEMVHDVGLTRHLDECEADPGDAKPMPYTVETVIAGTVFDVELSLAPQTTELEVACVNHGLRLLTHVGGKSGAGFGCVDVAGYGDDAAYVDWLGDESHADGIIAFAKEL
jgi:hypothetical protein